MLRRCLRLTNGLGYAGRKPRAYPPAPTKDHEICPLDSHARCGIVSDDDAFSSDDEFATDAHDALVLGARAGELADIHEEYTRLLERRAGGAAGRAARGGLVRGRSRLCGRRGCGRGEIDETERDNLVRGLVLRRSCEVPSIGCSATLSSSEP